MAENQIFSARRRQHTVAAFEAIAAHAQAYRQASAQGAAAASPARTAAQGFPCHPGRPATSAGLAAPDPPARRTRARPGSRPPARASTMTGPAKTSSSRKET